MFGGVVVGGTRRATQLREKRSEAAAGISRQEIVKERHVIGAVRLQLAQRLDLAREELEAQLGIAERVVTGIAHELVVFDELVVRVLRESERRKLQCVHDWQLKELKPREKLFQNGNVVSPDVMAQEELGPLGQVVESDSDLRRREPAFERDSPAGVRPESGELMKDRFARMGCLDINANAAGLKVWNWSERRCRGEVARHSAVSDLPTTICALACAI
jgi:hypothetical protein